MCVIPQRIAVATVLFLCATAGMIARPAIAADIDKARSNALETAAIGAGKPAALTQPTTPAPVAFGVPAIRAIETGETVSGSEPDPETFDQRGLDIWWQAHVQRKP